MLIVNRWEHALYKTHKIIILEYWKKYFNKYKLFLPVYINTIYVTKYNINIIYRTEID